jgi:hypothetical protein
VYVGELVEKVTKDGVTTWKHYVEAPTGTAAVYLRRSGGTPAAETISPVDRLRCTLTDWR